MELSIIKIAGCLSINKDKYPDEIETTRLFLTKSKETDGTNLLYSIHLNDTESIKIGEIALIYDGEIWYKLDESYRHQGYMTEALTEVLHISKEEHYLSIEKRNKASKKVAKKLGFQKAKSRGDYYIYRKRS